MCEAMKAPATSGAPTTARENSVRRARNVISTSASARCDPGLDTFCSRTDEIVPRTTKVPTERAQARVLAGLIGALAALVILFLLPGSGGLPFLSSLPPG